MTDQETIHDKEVSFSKKHLYSFLTAFRFLTLLPIPWKADQDAKYFKDSLIWFPLVGLVIGLLCLIFTYVVSIFLPTEITSIFAVLFLGGISGFLHFDGLADTADGFFSSRPKERILEIMKDSRIGPMGVLAIVFILFLKIASFASLDSSTLFLCVLIIPFVGRCSLLFQMAVLNYARGSEGLGHLFYGTDIKRLASITLAVLVLVLLLIFRLQAIPLLIGILVVLFIYVKYCQSKIGGATGDTLGAGCEIIETAMAVLFTACI